MVELRVHWMKNRMKVHKKVHRIELGKVVKDHQMEGRQAVLKQAGYIAHL
jgi:hypothetical protein